MNRSGATAPTAHGEIYTPTKGGANDDERAALMRAAHAYLRENKDFLVHQVLVQQPYAIALLQPVGTDRTYWIALLKTDSGYEGVWKTRTDRGGRSELMATKKVDAPDLIKKVNWGMRLRPTSAELKKEFPETQILWLGRDNTGRWWVATKDVIDLSSAGGSTDEYGAAAYRDSAGRWHHGPMGATDGKIELSESFPIPQEVMSSMRAGGVEMWDPNKP